MKKNHGKFWKFIDNSLEIQKNWANLNEHLVNEINDLVLKQFEKFEWDMARRSQKGTKNVSRGAKTHSRL